MNEEKKIKRQIAAAITDVYVRHFIANPPPNEGVVERGQLIGLSMTNFMNYDHWQIPFNSNINIFNSDDLSVKTAICEALFIGLGGNENRQGRYKNVKDYVKNKISPAIILLTLWNNKKPPYNCDFIHIECVITGSKNYRRMYKLMDNKGNMILSDMNTSELLQQVRWNIRMMLDNPAVMMPQNESTTFFFSTDPKTVYEAYMTASGSSTLEYDSSFNIRTELKLKEKQMHLQILDEENAQLMEEKEMQKSTDTDRGKLEDLKKKLQRLMGGELKKKTDDVQKLEGELMAMQNQKQELKTKIREFNEKREQCVKEVDQNVEKLARVQSSRASNKEECSSKRVKKQKLTREIKMMKREVVVYTEKINRLEEKRKQQNKLNQLEGELHQTDSKLREQKENEAKLAKKIENSNECLQLLQKEFEICDVAIDETQREIDRLKQIRDNPDTIFGRNIPELLNAIKQNNDFRCPPLGPLGVYINLKKSDWTEVIEDYIGEDMLRTFYVDNKYDRRTLRKIMKEFSWDKDKPKIIRIPFCSEPFELPREDEYENLLDVLGISDSIVANCLRYRPNSYDRVLLKNTTETNVVTCPQYCITVLNKQGDTIYPGSEPRRYELPEAEFLKPIEIRIKETEHYLSFVMREKDKLIKQRNEDNQLLTVENHNLRQTKDSVKMYELRQREISDSMAAVVVTDDNISELDNSEDCIAKMEALKKKINKKEDEELRLQDEIKKLQFSSNSKERTNLKNRKYKLERDCKKYKESIADEENKLREVREALESKKHDLLEVRKIVENLDAGIEEQNFTFELEVPDDNELQPEIYPQGSQDEITRQIKELEERIATAERRRATDIDARLEANVKERDETVQSISEREAKLNEMKRIQSDLRNDMNNDDCNKLQQEFRRLLDFKGFEGNLVIDSEERKLRPSNIPLNASGFQKLYYVMAFVLAFWKCTIFPLYIIGNFDFFMDSNDKKLAMKIVSEHMRRNPHRQFLVFRDLGNLDSIRRDCVTHHIPPVPQPTPGTSQSD